MKTTVRRALTAALAVFAVGLAAWAIAGEPAAGRESSGSSKSPSSRVASLADTGSLEEFLGRVLRNHPDILAAEARLESVQAELTRTRFEITRELITLWNERKFQLQNVQHLEKIYKGSGGTPMVRDLIDAKGKATEIEAQVSYLLGQMGGAAARAPAAAESKRLPQGPMVEEVSAALAKPAEMAFIQTPIRDVADTIMDFHDTTFVTDPSLQNVMVTIDIKGMPLGAALQAFEHIIEGVRFVVCDYGILVTSDDSEAAATYISANEFWREQLAQEATGQGSPQAVEVREGEILFRVTPRKPGASKGAPSADSFAPTKPAKR